jgi:hypothetical protein
MALIKRSVTKARHGNAIKARIGKAASLASLPKAARRVQPTNISPTPTTHNLYSTHSRPPSLRSILQQNLSTKIIAPNIHALSAQVADAFTIMGPGTLSALATQTLSALAKEPLSIPGEGFSTPAEQFSTLVTD